EISSMYTAYLLRSQKAHGIELRDAGSFVGQLLIRSFARAERVYAAMKCRGYNEAERHVNSTPLKNTDIIFILICISCFFSLRIFNIPSIFSQMIGRWL
ncbi:MAG: CbiQ family ECF transporter T component, partial [Oscillospiraceae bacterium]